MSISPLAGKPAPKSLLIDPARLERDYYEKSPSLDDPGQMVSFGTSGHRGSPSAGTFNESHILAICQAIAEHRAARGVSGPLFIGKDTHAASGPAQRTAVEVLTANGVDCVIQPGGGFTPTPTISHAILTYNRGRRDGLADGVIITPSHNPPEDGGLKYNPPNGGPAGSDETSIIQKRANDLLRGGNRGVKRGNGPAREQDFLMPYVRDLGNVIDMDAIRSARLRLGVDPLGGAAAAYWAPVAEVFGLDLTVVSARVDPTFGFMTVDHDGKIRMDCSSAYAMTGLIALKDKFDVAWGNDPDSDRHGIVTPTGGLMSPNHYLAAAIHYLLTHRPAWASARVGKTLVSSSIIDRVVASHGRGLVEVPVGFKWFAPGLFDGTLCFGGEESAGASFLRRDGTVWTTDKDGPILGLLAAEITAVTRKTPDLVYRELTSRFGDPAYTRIDAPAGAEQRKKLAALTPEAFTAPELAGEPVTSRLTTAPGNGAAIGGLKVTTANGWFAARPSGTEDIYKLYAESFQGPEHLSRIIAEAQAALAVALA